MAFDAGDIQGRLTLDRTPFTRELDKAQRQGKDFAKAKYTATLDGDRSGWTKAVNQARAAGLRFSQAKYSAKLSADRHELTRALKKAAEDVKRFNASRTDTAIGVDSTQLASDLKRIEKMSHNTGIVVANNFRSPWRRFKWPAIFAGITAAALAVPPALVGVGGAVAALAGAFVGPVKALTQFNKASDAVASGADNAAEQISKFNGMMAKLTPQGRQFVAQAMDMRDEMSTFGKEMQRSVLPGFTSMLEGIEQAAPAITRGSAAVGAAVSDVAAATGQLFRSTKFQGQLEDAFRNSVPVVRSLGMFVRNLVKDITVFTASTRTLGLGLSGMLDNVSGGFTRFFTNAIPYSDTLGQSFDSLGGIVGDLFGALGRFSGIISTGFGPGLGVMRGALDSLYGVTNSLTESAMPGLTTAFSAFASVVGGVLTALGPLIPLLGGVVGALAPFALALKAINVISFAGLSKSFQGLRASVGGVAGPINKTKTALRGLATIGFGPLGIAAAGLGIVLTLLGQNQQRAAQAAAAHHARVQELTQAMIEDNGAIGKATKASVAKALVDAGAAKAAVSLGVSLQSVTQAALGNDAAYKRVTGSLDAQIAAIVESGDALNGLNLNKKFFETITLNGAIKNQKTALDEATKAALQQQAAENGVTTAVIKHWNALNQLNAALVASVDKRLAYREAAFQQKQATEAATKALKEEGKGSDEYTSAVLQQERAILAQASAKAEAVRATNAMLAPERQAKLATEAFEREVFNLARTLKGPLPPALREIIGGMDATRAEALGARDGVDSAGRAVRRLPGGRTILIRADVHQAMQALRNFLAIPATKVINIVAGPMGAALAGLRAITGRAQGSIDQYATGGMTYNGKRVKGMASGSARMVPAGTPRLIGDNKAVRESFIPHDSSARSRTLLAETNRMMGNPLNAGASAVAVAPVPDIGRAVREALAGLEISLYVGGEMIQERVRVEVSSNTRNIVRAVKAGVGRAR